MNFCKSIALFLIFSYADAQLDWPCSSDWFEFENEKCFRILNNRTWTYVEAENDCALLEGGGVSTLAVINSKEEQEFLENYMETFERQIGSVWIGAKFVVAKSAFYWNDKTSLKSFTNWGTGKPTNNEDSCVKMKPNGKWHDVPCDAQLSGILCQMMRPWTIDYLQKTLLREMKNLKRELGEAKESIHFQLKQDLFPIGFVYVQLSDQPGPRSLWPSVSWKDVSSEYAGLFFRAEGGGSKTFNSGPQEENAPRLAQVHHHVGGGSWDTVSIAQDGWSRRVSVGGSVGPERALQFEISGGEVRPWNSAIRIWKRV